MGTDKALLVVDGRPMGVRVADALWEAGCHPVWCQGGDAASLAALGLDTVPDAAPGEGPVAAISSALQHAGGADVVTAACDLVDLDATTVASVARATAAGPCDVAVASAAGRDHLLACWSSSSAIRLRELVDAGTRALHEVLASLVVVRVEVPTAAVRNVNDPGDLPS